MPDLIRADVVDRDPRGELTPRYDQQVGVLVAESNVVEDWPYGINIAGRAILDLAHDRLLKNVDVQIARTSWKPDRELRWPEHSIRRSIRLQPTASSVPERLATMAVTVTHADQHRLVCVAFGEHEPDGTKAIELSPDALALLRDNRLCGFMFRLRG